MSSYIYAPEANSLDKADCNRLSDACPRIVHRGGAS